MGFLSRLFGRSPQPEAQWSIVRAVNETAAEAAVIRIRTDRPSEPKNLRSAIEISWPYTSDSPFPAPTDNQQMIAFEEAIDELASENGHSELVQVSTGNGVKEWLFYSADQSRFMQRMNELLKGHPVYPLQIEFYEDPDWQIWSETISALDQRSG